MTLLFGKRAKGGLLLCSTVLCICVRYSSGVGYAYNTTAHIQPFQMAVGGYGIAGWYQIGSARSRTRAIPALRAPGPSTRVRLAKCTGWNTYVPRTMCLLLTYRDIARLADSNNENALAAGDNDP